MAYGDEIYERAAALEQEHREMVQKLRGAVQDSVAKAMAASDARDRLLEANAGMLQEICYRVGAMSGEAVVCQRQAQAAIRTLREATGRDAATGLRPLAEKGVSPDPKAN